MPDYMTIDEMKALAPERQQRLTMLAAARSKVAKNTFLSHSSKDNELVPAAVLVLENHGGKVYVDLGDERLPQNPSLETAQILRDTVRELRRFVLLVSPNSKASNWIPWELGLADGQKTQSAVAVFPVVQYVTETRWTEREYLGLYPRVVWGKLQGYEKKLWLVYNHHRNTAERLSDWLHGY